MCNWPVLEIISVMQHEYKGEPPAATMVRTGPVETQVGNCVDSILQYYNWTTTAAEVFDDHHQERYALPHVFSLLNCFLESRCAFRNVGLNIREAD